MSEKSPLSPVQEEAPTLDALTQAIELLHGKVEAKRASLASIEEGREANPEGYEHWRKFYSHGLPELIANESELRSLASALPALLEASRLIESAREESYVFQETIELKELRIVELESQLAGSISERETLTAELEKFRDWFQNAEQARAVAESKLASRSVTRCQKCGAEALPSPTHALDLEAERDDARAAVERLTREKAQLSTQLEASQQFREQAIQDIEALPTFRVGKAGGLPEAVSRSAVLSILRGS